MSQNTISAAALEYGDASKIQVVSRQLPLLSSDEMLIRVHNSAITKADSMMRLGRPRFGRLFLGLRRPKNPYLGTGFSGTVIAMGDAVHDFGVGDPVFGETGTAFGANSDYIIVKQGGVVMKKPKGLPFKEAALMCDGPLTSFNFLTAISKAKAGQRILINGGAGALGMAGIQIAKALGCHVTATASPRNHHQLVSLGADKVLDYRAEIPFDQEGYDIIYDTVGKLNLKKGKKLLLARGTFMTPVLSLTVLCSVVCSRFLRSSKMTDFDATGLKKESDLKEFLNQLIQLYLEDRLKIPITETFELRDISQAHSLMDDGMKKGNFVVTHDIKDKE